MSVLSDFLLSRFVSHWMCSSSARYKDSSNFDNVLMANEKLLLVKVTQLLAKEEQLWIKEQH